MVLDTLLLPTMLYRLRRGSYDCIHAVEEAAFPALLAARLYKLPLLYDMQSSLPEQLKAHAFFSFAPIQKLLLRLESFLIRRVDIVACSAGLREYVEQIAPAKPVREWHYPTVDVTLPVSPSERLEGSLSLPAESFVILYTGNFEAYQGLDRLAKAIPLVLERIPNAVFIFVGCKPGESLPGLDASRVPEKALRVVSRQPYEYMASYLSIANVVVSPRLPIGNLPLKMLEYMASGKPIVATDSTAHRSVLHDGSAVLVEHSPEAIAAAILKLYENPALAQRLADTAYQFALEKLGWDVFIRETEQIYQELRQESRGP
jgi:glycosyltransferase involved in cell wall biosynthesis